MLFNSVIFLFFFILFFHCYWWINNLGWVKLRNAVTLLASYFFYGWWDWRFLGLIVLSSLVDFYIGSAIDRSDGAKAKKWLLSVSVIINLGVLGFFKYFNFFIDSLDGLLQHFGLSATGTTLDIILPVGISFYTFQTLSYTIDIYRGRMKATRDPLSFFVFVAFFPQLVAGPIERAKSLLPQFDSQKLFNYSLVSAGLRLAIWGLFKKVVIADNFGVLTDLLFDPKAEVNGFFTLLGAFSFAIQIYADFSGYSDIAIGISKMLGMDLMRNFKTPYFSGSFSEFWARWHISLSTWFRDYLYIPLGGNRSGTMKVYFNIMITFLVSGLWHGASATFLLWGACHGLLLILEKAANFKSRSFFAAPFVFIVTMLLWIPFRAQDLNQTWLMLGSLLTFNQAGLDGFLQFATTSVGVREGLLALVFALFMVFEKAIGTLGFEEVIIKWPKLSRWVVYFLLVGSIFLFTEMNVKPSFIYFQF